VAVLFTGNGADWVTAIAAVITAVAAVIAAFAALSNGRGIKSTKQTIQDNNEVIGQFHQRVADHLNIPLEDDKDVAV
jgi:hypothetical protein